MNRFWRRRWIGAALTTLAVAALIACDWLIRQRLGHAAIWTGAALLGCLFFLMLLGVRKRLVMLPLLKTSTWVQIHIYTGLFAMAAYLVHVPRVVADGVFEGGLSLLFLGVSLSGLYGVYVSRTAPRRLTAVPGEFRFDQVAWHRRKIAELADAVLDELNAAPASAVLATFYRDTLQPFFRGRPGLAYVALPTGVRRRRLLSGLGELDRYLETESRSMAGRWAALVRTRDDLDYHFALQLRLRLWVAVHAALSGALLLWACVHALLVLQLIG